MEEVIKRVNHRTAWRNVGRQGVIEVERKRPKDADAKGQRRHERVMVIMSRDATAEGFWRP